MEAWEKSDRELNIEELVEIYQQEFAASISAQAEETPNFEYWFGSGPYKGPVDIERRWGIGEEQLRNMVQWSLDHPEHKPWITPEGEKAIELGFDVELGGVMVKGFIDQIVETPEGIVVRDIKTGAKPGDIFQLATYAEAVRILHGTEVVGGDYFMGKTAKPTKLIRITQEDRDEVHSNFERLEADIQAERFEPHPSKNNCTMCAVKLSCEFAVA